MSGGVVGTYVHTYDAPRRQSLQPVPHARPAQDPQSGPSATPIYDALYAEWVRCFRALPGDRHGEEELAFTAFGNLAHGTGGYGSSSYTSSFSSYSAGAYSARHGGVTPGHTTTATAVWHPVGRQQEGTGMHHVPAALPPAPRRGL